MAYSHTTLYPVQFAPIQPHILYSPISHTSPYPIQPVPIQPHFPYTLCPYSPISYTALFPIQPHIPYSPISHRAPYPIEPHISYSLCPYIPISHTTPHPIQPHIPYTLIPHTPHIPYTLCLYTPTSNTPSIHPTSHTPHAPYTPISPTAAHPMTWGCRGVQRGPIPVCQERRPRCRRALCQAGSAALTIKPGQGGGRWEPPPRSRCHKPCASHPLITRGAWSLTPEC